MFESLWDHRGPQVMMEMKGFLQIKKKKKRERASCGIVKHGVNVSRQKVDDEAETERERLYGCNGQSLSSLRAKK